MKMSFEYDRRYSPAFPILEFEARGVNSERTRTLVGLIDSGSDATQLPLSILRSIGARPVDRRWVRDLAGIRYAVAVYAVRLQIGDLLLPEMEVIGREGSAEVIIGRDVLNQLLVTLNGLAFVTEISD
jgi:predicted aspartyl protease